MKARLLAMVLWGTHGCTTPPCGTGTPWSARCTDASDAGGPFSSSFSSSSTGSSANPAGSSGSSSSASTAASSSRAPVPSSLPPDAGQPDACVPLECAGRCGRLEDPCGNAIECGGCTSPQQCGALVPMRCDEPDLSAPVVHFLVVPPELSSRTDALFHFHAEDQGGSGIAGWSCSMDGQPGTPCAPPTTVNNLSAGAHVFSVVARDGAGNLSQPAQTAFTLDVEGPHCTWANAATCLASTTASFDFTCADDTELLTVECVLDGLESVPCTNRVDLEALAQGPHALRVTAWDGAGNASVPALLAFAVDASPPVVLLGNPPSTTRQASVLVPFSVEDFLGCGVLTTVCSVDGAPAVPCESPFEAAAAATGVHQVCVVARDAAGNTSTPSCVSWHVDVAPPTLNILPIPTQVSTSYTQVLTVPFSFTCEDSGSGCSSSPAQCTVDGVADGVVCGALEGQVAVGGDGANRAFGIHRLEVTAADSAGNVARAEALFSVVRCARDLQYPNRTSNGFSRGGCCEGLEVLTDYDEDLGFHPRADGACRPPADRKAQAWESPWPSVDCADGLKSAADWLVADVCSERAGAMCVASQPVAETVCGVGITPTPLKTPLHGLAGEGPYPDPSAGCVDGQPAQGLVATRKQNTNLCQGDPNRGTDRDAVGALQECAQGLTRHCRTNPNPSATACVCADADPYADDGRN